MAEENIDLIPRPARRKLLAVVSIIQLAIFALLSRQPARLHLDAISYMRAAKYWSEGNLQLAITGYWSPMISWLIAAFLPNAQNLERAGQCAMALSGLVYLWGFGALLRRIPLPGIPRMFLYVTCSFFILFNSFLLVADIMMSGILFFAVGRMLSRRWFTSRRLQILSGILVGLAYLAKAVALPVGLLTAGVLALWWRGLLKGKLRTAAACVLFTICGAALTAGPWIYLISAKFHRVTIGTAGRHAHSLVGPNAEVAFSEHRPVDPDSLEPPDGDVGNWSPLDDFSSFAWQLKIIGQNLLRLTLVVSRLDFFSVGIAAAIASFFWADFRRMKLRGERWRWALILIVCQIVIYLPVLSNSSRYYFYLFPYWLIAACGCLTWFTRQSFDAIRMPLIFVALVVLATTISEAAFISNFVREFLLVAAPGMLIGIFVAVAWLMRRELLTRRVVFWLGLGLIFNSFAFEDAARVANAIVKNPHEDVQARYVAGRLKELGLAGPLAMVSHKQSLPTYDAIPFLLEQPLLVSVDDAKTGADQAAKSGARIMVVLRDPPSGAVSTKLLNDPRFENLDQQIYRESAEKIAKQPFVVYAIHPAAGNDVPIE